MAIRSKPSIITTTAIILLTVQLASSREIKPRRSMTSTKPKVEVPFTSIKGKSLDEVINERVQIDVIVIGTVVRKLIKDLVGEVRSIETRKAKLKTDFLRKKIGEQVKTIIFRCGFLEDNDGMGGPFRKSHDKPRELCNTVISQLNSCYPRLLDTVDDIIKLQEIKEKVENIRYTDRLTDKGKRVRLRKLEIEFNFRCRYMISSQIKNIETCPRSGVRILKVNLPSCSLNTSIPRGRSLKQSKRTGFGSLIYR